MKSNKKINLLYIFIYVIIFIILCYIIYKHSSYNKNVKYDNFQNQEKANIIDISLGILSYNAPDTLEQTLSTYKNSSLLDISNDVFVILQKSDKQDKEAQVCEKYNIRYIKLI